MLGHFRLHLSRNRQLGAGFRRNIGTARCDDPYMRKFRQSHEDVSQHFDLPSESPEWHDLLNRLRIGTLGRLREKMAEQNMAAVVLTDSQNIQYATGARNMSLYHMRNPVRYCMVPLEGDVILYESAFGDRVLTEALPTIGEVREPVGVTMTAAGSRLQEMATRWGRQMEDVLLPITKKFGCRRIGIERFNVRATQILGASGHFDLVDAEEAVIPARAVKLPEEVEVVRRGITVVEDAVQALERALQPGITENEVWSVMHQHVIAKGGFWVETRLLNSGPRTNPWYQECGERRIQAGELVCLDTDVYGPEGYFVDFSRTFLCGDQPPSPQQRTNYQLAKEMNDYNQGVLRPGMTFKEFSEKAWKIPAPYVKNSYLVSVHGNGVSGEYPLIYHPHAWEDWGYDGMIEEGMTLSFEAYIGHEDGGEGVKLEEHVLITENGSVNLSHYPYDARLLG